MKQESGMRYFPIGLFASVMGMSGVAMSLRLFENVYGMAHTFSNAVTLLATLMFIINILFLIYRLAKYFDDVKMDFNNPIKINFYAAISISLLLLGTLYADFNMFLSFVVWII